MDMSLIDHDRRYDPSLCRRWASWKLQQHSGTEPRDRRAESAQFLYWLPRRSELIQMPVKCLMTRFVNAAADATMSA